MWGWQLPGGFSARAQLTVFKSFSLLLSNKDMNGWIKSGTIFVSLFHSLHPLIFYPSLAMSAGKAQSETMSSQEKEKVAFSAWKQ